MLKAHGGCGWLLITSIKILHKQNHDKKKKKPHFFRQMCQYGTNSSQASPSKLSISVRTLASFLGDAGECCISTGWVTGLDIVPAAAKTFKGKGQSALPFSQQVRKWIQRHQIWTWKYKHRHCNAVQGTCWGDLSHSAQLQETHTDAQPRHTNQ